MNTETAMTRQNENQPAQVRQPREEPALMPAVDVVEDAGGITLYADLPGVSKEQLELRVESETLTIEGRLAIELPEGMEASHAEVGLSRFRRVFTLSKDLDADQVSAELNQGVLRLRIPKAQHARPRRIEVKVG